MNITMQACGMAVLLLLIVFVNSHKTLGLYHERLFNTALAIITLSLACDMLSLVAIDARSTLPPLVVEFCCKFYVVTLVWGAWSAFAYVLGDAFSQRRHARIMRWMVAVNLVFSLVVFALPIEIHDAAGEVYTTGPSVLVVYAVAAFYILATIITAVVIRKRMNPRRFMAIELWMLIWVASMVIQFTDNSLLVVGFASAMGVLILFVAVENPESTIDRRMGCFNFSSLYECLEDRMASGKPFAVLELSLVNQGGDEERPLPVAEFSREVLKVLDRCPGVLVFKNVNLSLVLVAPSEEPLRHAADELSQTLAGQEAFAKNSIIILTGQTGSFDNVTDLFNFLHYVRMVHAGQEPGLYVADAEMLRAFQEKQGVEREIAAALRDDRVEVFLQPIFSTGEQRFSSAEALVRIRREDGSLLSPGLFIPIAEENGQILELGERVFEKVCAFLSSEDSQGLGLDYIEVNLSVVQCEQPDLAQALLSIVRRYGVDPARINLEITETASISARRQLLANMNALIEEGFSFSLDDFGKGESNLMYVVEMPVSIVKLDYDISKAFFSNPKASQVVRAVVGMAHGMGLHLVSEGIETESEAQAMHVEGMDYIQGYYYSRPLPMAEFVEFMRAANVA